MVNLGAVSFTNRPFCITIQRPNPHIFFMKVSFNESKSRYSSAVRRKNKRLHLPSIFPNRLYVCQSQERKMLYTCNNSSMAKTSMVHNSTNNFSTESNFDTTNQTPFDEFPRKIHFLVQKCQLSGLTISRNPSL